MFNMFAELKNHGYFLRFLTNSKTQEQKLKQIKWPLSKLRFLRGQSNNAKLLFFILFLPLLSTAYWLNLLWQKIKYKTKIIICFSWPEKIIFTLTARILKIKIIWLEFPGQNFYSSQVLLKKLYKFNSRFSKIIIFNKSNKTKLLNSGIAEKNIVYIAPGIKNANLLRQDNIFSGLVEINQTKKSKYFTIGTILPAIGKDNTEILCQAIKNCFTVISNLQLIIIGDKSKKENLAWFIKKIGIDNIVWFVGEPAYPGKWLAGFDALIYTGDILSLSDFMMAIRAAALALPIIGPEDIGLEDIIINEKNGYLINAGNSESLSQNIIRLQQNPHLRKRLGNAGKEIVNSNFQLDKMTEQFIATLEK